MIVKYSFLAGILGFLIGFTPVMLYTNVLWFSLLIGVALAGVFASITAGAVWMLLPPAIRNIAMSWKTGFLIIGVGSDKKLRLIPAYSDGFIIRPKLKPYSEKYRWAADGESAYPIHQGKGTQAIIAFMGYSFPLAADKAAAITKFREKGYDNLEELKTAVELPSIQDVERRITALQTLRQQVEGMDDQAVEERYGTSKQDVLGEIDAQLRRLEKVKRLVQEYGGGQDLKVDIDGATVRARDLINYLVWRHHPAELDRIIKSETNALLSRMNTFDLMKQFMPLIVIAGLVIIGVLGAVYLVTHGSPAPVHTVKIGG